MLTVLVLVLVLVLVGRRHAKDLIARIESIPEVCVLSHTDDSSLALARARVLLPDVTSSPSENRCAPPRGGSAACGPGGAPGAA